MAEVKEWKNVRPEWCPHKDCGHLLCIQNVMCCGRLPKPADHPPYKAVNTHRFCLRNVLPAEEVFDLQVCKGDLWQFDRLFNAIRKDEGRRK